MRAALTGRYEVLIPISSGATFDADGIDEAERSAVEQPPSSSATSPSRIG
jgi:hypothetical protein